MFCSIVFTFEDESFGGVNWEDPAPAERASEYFLNVLPASALGCFCALLFIRAKVSFFLKFVNGACIRPYHAYLVAEHNDDE